MSQSLSRKQAILLGICVLLVFALAGTALSIFGDRAGWGGGNFRVRVAFDDIAGVEVGSRIRIQGMEAGDVEAILPPEQPGDKVMLRLRIAGKFRNLVRADAKVQLASESMFAGKLVRILPGSPTAPPIDELGELKADVQPDAMEQIAQAAGKLNKLLVEVDTAMQSFRDSESSVTQDLLGATRKLNSVLTKADATLTSIEKGEGTLGKLVKDEKLYTELTQSLQMVKSAMNDVKNGEGTLGKLIKTNDAYAEAMSSLEDVRRMVNSVKQNSDAIKALPVVRNYVVDPAKELVRPDMKRFRKWYAEADLFEPGKAVLTDKGRGLLDDGGAWLNEQKYAGAELMIAAFADPMQKPEFAQTVTTKQAEIVLEYLRSKHSIHRTGWWWWSTRLTRSIGCGTTPTPVPETEKMPMARIELIVFAP